MHFWILQYDMGGSPGDVGEAKEGLQNELWRRWSDRKLGECATCPVHFSCLNVRFLIILGEEYNAHSSGLSNFLHSSVISSLLAPNIFLSTSFSNTLNLRSSLRPRDQISELYNIGLTGNIIVLYILTFNFFKAERTTKFSEVNNNKHFPCLFCA